MPVAVPGPPVKKRRRDEINAALVVEDLKGVFSDDDDDNDVFSQSQRVFICK